MLGVAAVLALCLTACSSGEESFPGTWGSGDAGQPNLTIDDDSSYSGSDGCNRVNGQGTISGDTFRFGSMIGTMMACEGVDDWLRQADTAKVIDGDLVVYDDEGKKIGTLDGD